MKKKISITIPIIILALIVIAVIPKHTDNDDIEEISQEVAEISEVSEPTSEPEITTEPQPQPELTEPEIVEPEPEATEPEPEVTEPEQSEESDIEPLDKVMYATGNINTRSGPSVDFKKVGGLTVNQEVHVTGQSKTTGWYEIEVDGAKQYVSDKLLSDNKVQESKPNSNGNGGGGSTTPSGNGNTNAKAMEVLKSLGVDTSKDASQDVAAPAPDWNVKAPDELKGVEAY